MLQETVLRWIFEACDVNDNPNIAEDEKLQQNYEAEVKVYRALEKLDEPIIVLHGLLYTHFRFRIWDSKHNTETCSSAKKMPCEKPNKTEEEHDFVVIGPDYLAIIEVKNPIYKQKNVTETVKKAREQFQRAETLVRAIAKKTNPEAQSSIRLFNIVAFPNFGQKDLSSVIEKSVNENFLVINEDHLKNFSSFWNGEIKTSSSWCTVCGDIDKIQCVLLRLLANGKTGTRIDESKVNLAECVREIDLKLRDSEITFKSKNRPDNPNVWKTSDLPLVEGINIFQDCLGLKYITTEQKNAYDSTEDHLIISGPPGSGKTLILLARIIRLALTEPDAKILFYVQNSMKLGNYQKVFGSISIKYCITNNSDLSSPHSSWRDKQPQQVKIYHRERNDPRCGPKAFPDHDFDYVFLDDFQSVLLPSEFFTAPRKINGLGVDFNQSDFARQSCYSGKKVHLVQGYMDKFTRIKLEKTYRNTHNIVTQLTTLSKLKSPFYHGDTNYTNFKNQFFHTPSWGHFIHGPQLLVKIYVAGERPKQFVENKLIPRIFSEMVTSDGKKSEKNANKACIFTNEISKINIDADLPVCSDGADGFLCHLASTEFTECQIVCSYDSFNNIKISRTTISLILSELLELKTDLEKTMDLSSLHIPDKMKTKLCESLQLLDETISMLDFIKTVGIILIPSKYNGLHEIKHELNILQKLLNCSDPASKLMLSYQMMCEALEIMSEIHSTQEMYKIKMQKSHRLRESQHIEIEYLEKHWKELFEKLDRIVIEAEAKVEEITPPSHFPQTGTTAALRSTLNAVKNMLSWPCGLRYQQEIATVFETYHLNLDFITASLERTIEKLNGVQNEKTDFILPHLNDNIERLESRRKELTKISEAKLESLLSMLFNAISRTRVLCRIHLAYENLFPTSNQIAEYFWRKIFPDARFRFVNVEDL